MNLPTSANKTKKKEKKATIELSSWELGGGE